MRNHLVLMLSALVIGAVLCSGCFSDSEPVFKPDVSTTSLKIDYTGPVTSDYGTYDCFHKTGTITPKEIVFNEFNCRMDYASFGKTSNDTRKDVLTMDLVRDGQVIKRYSTSTGSVRLNKIREFLVRSLQEPGLVLDIPVTAKVSADGGWSGWFLDAFGAQYESGKGSASMTLIHPVLPVEACVRSQEDAGAPPPSVELWRGDTLLKQSGAKNQYNQSCAVYP